MPSTRLMAGTEMAGSEVKVSETGTADMSGIGNAARPGLATGVRMRFDPARDQHVLLSPEAILVLNPAGAEIVELCDGERTIAEIGAELRSRYGEVGSDEVRGFIENLITRRVMEVGHD